MRNLIWGLVIGLIVGVILAVAGTNPNFSQLHTNYTQKAEAKKFWRLASLFPSSMYPAGSSTTQFVKKVNVLTKGTIELKLFQPGDLVPALDSFSAVSNGTIEAALTSPTYWGGKSLSFELLGGFPFGPRIEEYLAWYQIGGGRELSENLYRRHNIHGLVCGVFGPTVGGWFRRPVHKLSVFQDKLVAAVGLGATVLSRAGARTTLLAPQAIAPAFKSGELFGTTMAAPYGINQTELSNSTSYVYFPGWHRQFSVLDLIINLKNWNGIDSETQDRIKIACAANIADSLARTEGSQFNALKSLIDHGIEVDRWSPQMVNSLKLVWQNEVRRINSEDPDFRRFWNSLTKFSENYSIWQELGYL